MFNHKFKINEERMYMSLGIICLLFLILAIIIIMFKLMYVHIDSDVCLVGKTAVITGGSSGLGYEIALNLASRGCKIIIADIVVTDDVKESIIKNTDNPNIIIEYVDFASFQSVRKFADNLKRTEKKVDILVNNVGSPIVLKQPTVDSLLSTMQINYYSTFLLTHLLVELLKTSGNGRIIFTSSVSSFIHIISPYSLSPFINIEWLLRLFHIPYCDSKFCIVVASEIFAKKLEKYNITSNCYHPGVAKTNIFRSIKGTTYDVIYYVAIAIPVIFGIEAKKAAKTAIRLAISKEFNGVSGIFYGVYFPDLKPRLANNKEFCKAFWKHSEEIVHLRDSEKI